MLWHCCGAVVALSWHSCGAVAPLWSWAGPAADDEVSEAATCSSRLGSPRHLRVLFNGMRTGCLLCPLQSLLVFARDS